ncbi:MAG: hypothetical protein FWF67_01735 [Fibromonadales bacterium]|nr:hypothetical protein [Fibromonadales bacterium]
MSKNIYKFDPKKFYGTIDEVFVKVFNKDKKPQERCGVFKPLPEFKGTKYEGCHIWFPKTKSGKKADWKNELVKDREWIISRNFEQEGKALLNQKNITFADEGDGYHYVGTFELVSRAELWKKLKRR